MVAARTIARYLRVHGGAPQPVAAPAKRAGVQHSLPRISGLSCRGGRYRGVQCLRYNCTRRILLDLARPAHGDLHVGSVIGTVPRWDGGVALECGLSCWLRRLGRPNSGVLPTFGQRVRRRRARLAHQHHLESSAPRNTRQTLSCSPQSVCPRRRLLFIRL